MSSTSKKRRSRGEDDTLQGPSPKVTKSRATKKTTTLVPTEVDQTNWTITKNDLPPRNSAARGMELFRQALPDMRLKKDAPHKITPPITAAKHISEFPKLRDYQLCANEIRTGKIWVGGTEGTGKNPKYQDATEKKVWKFKAVWKRTNQPTEQIQFFFNPAGKVKPERHGITFDICPDHAALERLAGLVIDYTNRFPGNIDAGQWHWNKGQSYYMPRLFIEVAALLAYDPTLDLPKVLGRNFLSEKKPTSAGYYRSLRHLASSLVDGTYRTEHKSMLAGCVQVTAAGDTEGVSRCLVTHKGDFSNIPPLPAAYDAFLDFGRNFNNDQAHKSMHLHLQSKLFGRIGSPEQIDALWQLEHNKLVTNVTSQRPPGNTGVFNNEPLFRRTNVNSEIHMSLALSTKAQCTVFSGLWQGGMYTGTYFITASGNRILHSHIRQVVLDTIADGKGLPRAILRGHEVSYRIDMGMISAQDVINLASTPRALEERSKRVVVCMHCHHTLLDIDVQIDEGGRRLCGKCYKLSDTSDAPRDRETGPTIETTVFRLSRALLRADARAADGTRPVKLDAIMQALKKNITDDTQWTSRSSKGTKSSQKANWELAQDPTCPAVLRGRSYAFKHMDQVSVGKDMPMIVVGKTTYLHYADNDKANTNVFLQTLLENFVQGGHTMGSQPVIGQAAAIANTLPDVTEQPSFDYPQRHRPFYQILHTVARNDLMICSGIPYTRVGRLEQDIWTSADMPRLKKMWKSSNWDGKEMRPAQRQVMTRATMNAFRSMTRLDGTQRKRFPDWTGENLQRILKNIQTIVKPGGRFNKHGLKLTPNADGSYWLGLDEERPADADLEFERREHESRLWTIDENCDVQHVTKESDETIMYEAIIQFLRFAGKCHGLKFRLSVMSGHLQVYSWGRAVYRRNEQGEPVGPPIQAGDPMRTGCKVPHPTNLEDPDQYDFERCTMIRESQLLNYARHNFPLSDYNIDMASIVDRIAQISPDAELADRPLQRADQYHDVPFLKAWKWRVCADKQDSSKPPVSVDEAKELFMSMQEKLGIEDLDKFDDASKEVADEDDDLAELQEDLDSTMARIQANHSMLVEDAYVQELELDMKRAIKSDWPEILYRAYKQQLMDFVDNNAVRSKDKLRNQLDDLQTHLDDDFKDVLDETSNALVTEMEKCVSANDASAFRDLKIRLMDQLQRQKGAAGSSPPLKCFDCDGLLPKDFVMCTTEGHEDRKLHLHCIPSGDQDQPSTWQCKDCRNAPLCFDCGRPVGESDIICMTEEHNDRSLHFDCVPSASRDDQNTWRCKDCRQPPGGGGPGQMLNMRNLGWSCYLASSVLVLYCIKPLHDLIMDQDLEFASLNTGRDPRHWLPSHDKPGENPAQGVVQGMLNTHMRTAKAFTAALRTLFTRLSQTSRAVTKADVQPFFDAFRALDPDHILPTAQDDASDALQLMLNALFLVTDNSMAGRITAGDAQANVNNHLRTRGLFCDLNSDMIAFRMRTSCCGKDYDRDCIVKYLKHDNTCPNHETCSRSCEELVTIADLTQEETERARQLRPLGEDAHDHWRISRAAGFESPFLDQFHIQYVTEWQCSKVDCTVIGRTFHPVPNLELHFGPNDDAGILRTMMEQWQIEHLDSSYTKPCGSGVRSPAHGSTRVLNKITKAPRYLNIRFPRQSGAINTPVHVPEFLDITPISNQAALPSDGGQPLSMVNDPIYRLIAVTVYYSHAVAPEPSGHYVLYFLQNGVWMCLDDMSGMHAVTQHPQAAFNDGGLAYFVVYERVTGKGALPLDAANNPTEGHVLRNNTAIPPAKVPEPKWEPSDGPGGSCRLCEKQFPDEKSLKDHEAQCTLKCTKCDTSFNDKDLFKAHQAQCKPPGSSEQERREKEIEERMKGEFEERLKLEKLILEQQLLQDQLRKEIAEAEAAGDDTVAATKLKALKKALQRENRHDIDLLRIVRVRHDELHGRCGDLKREFELL